MAPVDAQITAQARLREIVVRAVGNAWTQLGSYDAPDVARFLAVAVPIILAAQRYAVSLSDAYVARVLGRAPLGIDPAPVIAAVRGDTTPQITYRRPFITTWSDLQAGKPYGQAVAAGRSRAAAASAMDVQMAQRGAFAAIQEQDRRIKAWSRRADPGACPFCQMIDGAKVLHATAMPLHPRCGCSLEPRIEPSEPTPLPAGVEVFAHGEYGPTLGDPSHDHLTEAEALGRS